MCRTDLLKLIGLASMSFVLFACGGSDDSKAILDEYDDSNSHLDDIIDDIEGGSTGKYLNCSALDPKKVYLVGSVGLASDGGEAIIDLENPTDYCMGFDDTEEEGNMTVTNSGKALFFTTVGDLNPLYELVQDNLGEISDGKGGEEWDVPTNVRANDVLVTEFPENAGSSGLFLRQDGSTSYQVYYQNTSPRTVYRNDSIDPLFSNPNELILIGVMPDGSLLMYKDTTLYLVDTSFNETALSSPDAGAYIFEHTSRVFTANSGNQSVWILVHDSEYTNVKRWSIDLVTKTVTDDGFFAAVPDYVNPSHEDIVGRNGRYYKLDGDGNLIQVAIYSANPPGTSRDITSENYRSLVIKRPIASSEQSSEILFSDAEYKGDFKWRQENWPVPHIMAGIMGSGPIFTGQ